MVRAQTAASPEDTRERSAGHGVQRSPYARAPSSSNKRDAVGNETAGSTPAAASLEPPSAPDAGSMTRPDDDEVSRRESGRTDHHVQRPAGTPLREIVPGLLWVREHPVRLVGCRFLTRMWGRPRPAPSCDCSREIGRPRGSLWSDSSRGTSTAPSSPTASCSIANLARPSARLGGGCSSLDPADFGIREISGGPRATGAVP